MDKAAKSTLSGELSKSQSDFLGSSSEFLEMLKSRWNIENRQGTLNSDNQ